MTTGDSLEITDQADPSLHFRMKYWPREEAVALSIKTKTRDEQQHPDLYAAELVERGVAYFEDQGLSVKKIRGEFRPHTNSDNYRKYDAHLKKLIQEKGPQNITSEDRREAARQPWTANVAASLGFTNLESMEVTDDARVIVYFGKPNSKKSSI